MTIDISKFASSKREEWGKIAAEIDQLAAERYLTVSLFDEHNWDEPMVIAIVVHSGEKAAKFADQTGIVFTAQRTQWTSNKTWLDYMLAVREHLLSIEIPAPVTAEPITNAAKISVLYTAREQLQQVVNSILVRVPFDDVATRYPMAETRIKAAVVSLRGINIGAMQLALTNTIASLDELLADMHIDSRTLADELSECVKTIRTAGQVLYMADQGVDAFGNPVSWNPGLFDEQAVYGHEAEYV